jgi:N-acetylated-alpha-linked acidic dipeptidase
LRPSARGVGAAVAAAGAVALALAGFTIGNGGGEPLLGFSSEGTAREREAEARLVAGLSGESVARFNLALSAGPHVAGTPDGRAVADRIAETLRGFGFPVEVRTYRAYLSYPRRVAVSLRAPEARELPVREPATPDEPPGADALLTPGFVAYSASAKVEAPVVYVNYGLPADYDALADGGVSARGALVLARYGKVHRAVKVSAAETRGAAGILVYSDPADDGFAQGDAWPRGPWRADGMLQRGNAKYSWFWHGDPLTPFAAATGGGDVRRLAPDEAATLPRIPAVVLSAAAARPILEGLSGPSAPRGFQGGLPFTYHVGPGSSRVALDVEMDAGLREIADVVARIEGREEPDRWVILGTHHDAWTFGGVDPGSAGAAILELARGLAALRKAGWQPRRTILIAFWDAEEYGLVGSTEFAEERAAELREKAVAYVNSDFYLAGRLRAGGSAALRDFTAEVARAVREPASAGTVYDSWKVEAWTRLSSAEKRRRGGRFEPELDPLGSGADFVAFQAFLGLPSLSLEFSIDGSYGAYHSRYDTHAYMETFGDPGWRYGPALAELLGRGVMRLAAADVVPLRFVHTADKIDDYLRGLEDGNAEGAGPARIPDLGLDPTRSRVATLRGRAALLDAALQKALSGGGLEADRRRALNNALTGAEKAFVTVEPEAPGPGARWYRHTVYGWDVHSLYAGDTLPGMGRALREGDAAAFARERERLDSALDRAASELGKAGSLAW